MFIALANGLYNFVVNTILRVYLKSKLLTWTAKKIVDLLAKPLYDWTIRKGYITIKKLDAEISQNNLEKAKTNSEIDKAIDEMP
jgi:hypothetical protein